MSLARGWSLPEQHLLPDAVVAFVDGELSAIAHDRVVAHLARCSLCAAETTTQRQARAAVRAAGTPAAPAGLLAALRSIPTETDLPGGPDNLALTDDGQLVMVQRPDRVAGLGSGPVIGSSPTLGHGWAVLRGRSLSGRRAVRGAGVVAAGLVLGALAITGPHALADGAGGPRTAQRGPVTAVGTGVYVLQAGFSSPAGGDAHPAAASDSVAPTPLLTRAPGR